MGGRFPKRRTPQHWAVTTTMSVVTETTVIGQSNLYMVKVLARAVPDTVCVIASIDEEMS